MKKYIIISSIFILFLTSCTDGFDESFLLKSNVVPNGNEIINTERVHGDEGGQKSFYGIFLSNEKSMYYYGLNGISSDRYLGQREKYYSEGNYIVGKINELGDVAWEKTFNEDDWIGGMVQNSRNDLYIYGQKYENSRYQKYIANVSNNGTIKELNLESLSALYIITSIKQIDNDLFLLVGTDRDKNNYLIILTLSSMKAEVIQSVVYSTDKYWIISHVEQLTTDAYDAVLTGQNENSQLIVRKLNINNADVSTLWEQTITSDIVQNPSSNLTSSRSYAKNQAVKIDDEICVVGYGDNDIEHTGVKSYVWQRALVANLNYNTGELNWLRTIPFRNTMVYDVYARAIHYSDNYFYVIGEYNSVMKTENKQFLSHGFVQKISRNGELRDSYVFGDEKENSAFNDAVILNKKLFLFGYKGRGFQEDFPYPNLMVNTQVFQAWFVSCSINDF